jgi:hypothetical protein
MPFVFIFLLNFAIQVIRQVSLNMREVQKDSLCVGCFHAHMQYGARGGRTISCTYGGVVRPMRLDVLYCTDYRSRSKPPHKNLIGFVREIAPAE